MKKLYFLLFMLLIASVSFGQVIITEIADPNNDATARYVEIYNAGTTGFDLTGYELRRWTNENATPQTTGIDLSSIGTLGAGQFAIIAANGTAFQTQFGISADISAGTGGAADSNGDDQIAILDGTDTIVDIFGVPGEDGTGTCHEFEDGRAERKASVTTSNTSWDEAEWNVWADSSVSGCTSHIGTAQDAPGTFDPKAWIGTATGPSITLGGDVSGLDYFEGFGPSDEGSFSVDGINLTEEILVSAPTNFELSLTSGGTFTPTVSVTQTGGTASDLVYVRLISGLTPNTYTNNATASSAGATSQTVSLSGVVTAADPQITVTAFLDPLNYSFGSGPSPEDSFTVEGLFLTSDIVVTSPSPAFELSLTSGGTFSASVNVPFGSGTVATTPVYVRLASGLPENSYSGDITVSSTGVTDELVPVTGNVFGPPTNALTITGVFDASIGSSPKGVELYVNQDIPDLSLFGIGSANNGGGTDGQEFTFPAVSATQGDFIYIVSSGQLADFSNFFGISANYESGAMSINGDDAIELFENDQVIDVFGTIDCDPNAASSTCPEWDHTDGWAYRINNTGPDGSTFVLANWSFSGIDN